MSRTILLLAAVLATSTASSSAAAPKIVDAECSGEQVGDTATVGYTMRLRRKKPITITSTLARDGDRETQTTRIARGRALAMDLRIEFSPLGTTLRASFGKGVKGAKQFDVLREGDLFRAIVDGRPTALFAADSEPGGLVFEDGQPPPRVSIRRDLQKALAVFAKVGPPPCYRAYAGLESPPPTGGRGSRAKGILPAGGFEEIGECLLPIDFELATRARPAGSLDPPCQKDAFGTCDSHPGCNGCKACCYVKAVECSHAAVAAGVGCAKVLGLFGVLACTVVNEALCIKLTDDCSNACRAEGNPCCPKICSNRCTGPKDWICCGEISGANSGICPADRCCGSEPGKYCCSAGQTCRDGKLCCEANAGDTCFGGRGCCPAGQKCIAGPEGETCCPEGQGVCGFDGNGEQACCPNGRCCTGDAGSFCCGAGDVCLPNGTCCNPANVCGQTCCPSGACLNGDTCCPSPEFTICGGSCCPSLTTTCCNGQCCDGACVNGACCPRDRECAGGCCAEGWRCTNRESGTCEPCPSGQQPCAPDPGNPACCPPGTACCGNGQCCANPAGQCCDFGAGQLCAQTCLE